jgi:hypothetical protein
MRPPYWNNRRKKVTWKIQQDYYPIVQQSWNDTEYCIKINELIKSGSTGSLEEMAKKLKMSINRGHSSVDLHNR